MKRIICLICCLTLLACCLVFPASADVVGAYSDIDLGEPSKIYNDDDTLTVTYDIPVTPYTEIRGKAPGSDVYTIVSYGNQIVFEQEMEEVITSYEQTELHSLTVTTSRSESTYYYNYIFDFGSFSSFVDFASNVDGVVVNDTLYVGEFSYYNSDNYGFGNWYYLYRYSSDNNPEYPFLFRQSPGNLFFYAATKDTYSISFVSLEPVIEYTHPWDYIKATSYLLGYSGYYNVIDISDIKPGSDFDLDFSLQVEMSADYEISTGSGFTFQCIFLDAGGNVISTSDPYYRILSISTGDTVDFNTSFTVPAGAEYLYLKLDFPETSVKNVGYLNITCNTLSISTTLNSIEVNSGMMQGVSDKLDDLGVTMEDVKNGVTITNGKLDDINQSISDGNEKLDDINQGISDANDKLDDMNQGISDTNDKLDQSNEKLDDVNENLGNVENAVESLPGQIGDEIQSVIDQENARAEAEGNESAGELIELIPDQSGDVIAALGTLANALKYEGTEAKLTMPSVKLPSIDPLFSETVLLEEQEVDFESWFDIMPVSILSVVRALFDVAIVGFCFKEFIGLIGDIIGGATKLDND